MNRLTMLRQGGGEVLALGERVAAGDVPETSELATAALLAPMDGAPHDPVHHAEGDPLVHTHMVLGALVTGDGYCELGAQARLALALAALLHDSAKPETAQTADGRVSHPNHAPRGARKARAALYAAGLDPSVREATAVLCRRHMQPHHALNSHDGDAPLLRWMAAISLEVPVRLLLILASADEAGRITPSPDDSAALLRDFAEGHELLDAPWNFMDRTARLECCRGADRDPRYPTSKPETGPLVTVLSGLPATGKSTLARSMDAEHISVEDRLNQGMERGSAVQASRERLRQVLRDGRDAVWDATMLTRTMRHQLLSLAEDYGARCAIQCCELPEYERSVRNRKRPEPVPDDVVADMLGSWEMPTFDEALFINDRPARLG
ncbi:MAG: AAA family ATPase [Hyphomicrobiales bacterium]|nr:AAA family ATPase [Hyphomicrobiales bacterium]